MKYFKYQLMNRVNIGTEENVIWKESFLPKMIPATEENEIIAKEEAYNGIYEPVDIEEEVQTPTQLDRIEALEAALLEMMGVSL